MDSSNRKSGNLQKLGGGQKIFIFGRGGCPMWGRSENFHFEGSCPISGGGGNFLGGG